MRPGRRGHYGGGMTSALGTFARILARRWPVLAAWVLGSEAVHYLLIHLAGWVGSYTSVGGLLLLPLAVMARLVAYVAMYLVVRDDLPAVAARTRPVTSLRDFAGATSAAVLPFLVFYTAWGMLGADRREYAVIALDLVVKRDLGSSDPGAGKVLDLSFGWGPLLVLVVAFALRLLGAAFADRLPRWFAVPMVYVETVWVAMLVAFVQQFVVAAEDWVGTRAGGVWLEGIGASIAEALPWLGRVWESAGGLGGLLGSVILLPAAWIAIVGAIYGERVDTGVSLGRDSRWQVVLAAIGRRLEDIAFALRLVWRAGPVAVGFFLLAYAVWTFLNAAALAFAPRMFGEQPTEYWQAFPGLITVFVMAVFEPVRVALVSCAYDAFSTPGGSAEGVGGKLEPQRVDEERGGADLDAQGSRDVIRHQESDRRGRGPLV